MAYPTKPAGCLLRTDFVFNVSDASWSRTGFPDKQYLYAIMEMSDNPTAWQEDGQDRMRRISVSRAVDVDAGQSYNDAWYWVQPGVGDRRNLLEITYDSEESGWQAYQDQSVYATTITGRNTLGSRKFGVIEIVLWGGTENADLAQVASVSVDVINDDAYTAPGTSAIRQHVERMHVNTISPNAFASSYHAMWGLSESTNRCSYEDRNHNTWPIWGNQSGGGA